MNSKNLLGFLLTSALAALALCIIQIDAGHQLRTQSQGTGPDEARGIVGGPPESEHEANDSKSGASESEEHEEAGATNAVPQQESRSGSAPDNTQQESAGEPSEEHKLASEASAQAETSTGASEQEGVKQLQAGRAGSSSNTELPAAQSEVDQRLQPIGPHGLSEAEGPTEQRVESVGGPHVEEITSHCVQTHNKIRTARLDEWPNPLLSDDGLAEGARVHAKEYVNNKCKLPEASKLDYLTEMIIPKTGRACEGLDYVLLNGLSDIRKNLPSDFPGPFTPEDKNSVWHLESTQKLAFLMSDKGKFVGCAATVGCPHDVIFCRYSPSLTVGHEPFSRQVYNALNKRDRVESRNDEKPFLASSVADHEVKNSAGAKTASFEISSALFAARPVSANTLAILFPLVWLVL